MNIEDFVLDFVDVEWYIYNFNYDDLEIFIENLKYDYKYSDDKITSIFKDDKQFNTYWNNIMIK
tara:strand:- start:2135 stop:2326 length:192 start_codon:yes stop_codon:yes gene_type:complete